MSKKSVPGWLRVVVPAALICVWLGLGAVGGPYFGKIEEVSDVDLTAFLPASAEATKVNNQLAKFRSDSTLPAVVVFESRDALIDEADLAQLADLSTTLKQVDGVEGPISPPIISEDQQAAFAILPIDSQKSIPDVLAAARLLLDKADRGNTDYFITGPAGFAADLNKAFAGIDGILLLTAFAVVFVILIVVYRSVVLPVVVLLTSVFALSASILLVWWLAKLDIIQLNGQVQGILFILVIGAATDYSLLYVSRYREELYKYPSRLTATMKALKGSFEPIIASGGTVIVGLLCLLLSDLASNKALGPVGSIGIVFAMLSALTFLPAVLYAFGRASFWPLAPIATSKARAAHREKLERGIWHRVGRLISRKPRMSWIASLAVLLLAALFVPQIRAEGVAQSDLILGSSEARDGQAVLNKYFPDGSGSPALIIVDEAAVKNVVGAVDRVKGIEGITAVADNVESGFVPVGAQELKIRNEIAEQIRQSLPGDAADVSLLVDQAYPFKEGRIKTVDGAVLLQATLSDSPDSQAAKNTIVRLRQVVREVDATAIVGGTTAVQLDTNNASLRDRAIIIPVVLIAITLILMVLLRAVIVPILLLATTVLSFAASLGVAAVLFNNVWYFPGADPSVVLYAFVFLVALGIDYNIFLMTRVREETVKRGTAEGVIKGLVVTGGVITSAGIVLAATFAALGVIPILFLFQLAFIVAFGVLLDTFLVRSLLVPALIRDIGPFVWWPSRLKHKR